MIIGSVNSRREAIIQTAVRGEKGQFESITAVIDTGFTAYLSLPSALIQELALPWIMQEDGFLADGSICLFDTYRGWIIWDGKIRSIYIIASDTQPLIGMSLLEGFELRVQGVTGGTVTISALSPVGVSKSN